MAEKKNQDTEEVKTAQQHSKSDDTDMPAPQTSEYKTMFKLTQTFMNLLNQSVGTMPYSTILTNSNNEKIKLIDLIRFIEAKQNAINVDELNTVVGFIASAQFKYVRPLMEVVENAESQKSLWTEIQP